MKINRTKYQERGVALLAAIGFTLLVLALGLAIATMTTSEQKATRAHGDNITVRNVAEAGIDRAFYKLNQSPGWRNSTAVTEFTNAPVTVTVDGQTSTLGTFTVDPIQDMGGDYVQVTAHGTSPDGETTKTIRVLAYAKWGTPFSAAAFGKFGVPLANGETDSYHSGKGSYGGANKGNEGDIRTDSTDPSAIQIKSNGQCNGKVMYGPGTDLSKVTINRGDITDMDSNESNDIVVAPATAVMPPVVVPGNAVPISTINKGSNALNGNLTIPAGTWVCSGISLTGNSRIRTVGKVVLYVTGNMKIGGNGMANNGDDSGAMAYPADLLILATDACTSVAISGNGRLTGVVYAPNADIVLNGSGSNGEVFGALAGKTVGFNGNGTVLHYDVALKDVKGAITGFRTKTWEEM